MPKLHHSACTVVDVFSPFPILRANMATIIHPYYPQNLTLSGIDFVPNASGVFSLVAAFGTGWALILGVTFIVVSKINPAMKRPDSVLVLWFVLTGSIHLFFEGYFAFNHTRMASRTDFFGQLWKEYALSDSRYMTSNPFVLVMESWTVTIWGPLSFLTAILITTASPYRHPIQALVSTGQFYGNLLYYTTSLFEDFWSGNRFYRPERYYFWFYFISMNAIWLVIPAYCLYGSIKASAEAFKTEQRVQELMEKKCNKKE